MTASNRESGSGVKNSFTHRSIWLESGWRSRWLWLAVGLLGALMFLFGTGLLVTSGSLIAAAAARPPLADLMLFFVAVRFFGIGRAALRYTERLLSHDLVFRQLGRLRIQLFRAWVHTAAVVQLRWRTGDLLQRWTADLDKLQEAPLRILLPTIAASIVATVVAATLLLVAPALAIPFSLAAVWLGVVWPLLCMRRHNRNGIRRMLAMRRLQYRLAEGRLGREELWLSGAATTWRDDLARRLAVLDTIDRGEARLNGMQDTVALVTAVSLQLCMLLMVAVEVAAGTMGWPLAAGIILGTAAAIEGFVGLAPAWTRRAELRAIERRLAAGTDDTVQSSPNANPIPPLPAEPGFRLENISFAVGRTHILEDLSATFPSSGMICISGPSGSGKTTLAKIIAGLHEPQHGGIYRGNSSRPLPALERLPLFASCLQEIPLFRRSLRDNLKLGDASISDSALLQLLDRFQLTARFGSPPHALDATLDDQAGTLSGGEIKRLGIIRTLARKTPHLILDEPFEHLDRNLITTLCQTLAEEADKRLVVIISHTIPTEMKLAEASLITHTATGSRQEPTRPHSIRISRCRM